MSAHRPFRAGSRADRARPLGAAIAANQRGCQRVHPQRHVVRVAHPALGVWRAGRIRNRGGCHVANTAEPRRLAADILVPVWADEYLEYPRGDGGVAAGMMPDAPKGHAAGLIEVRDALRRPASKPSVLAAPFRAPPCVASTAQRRTAARIVSSSNCGAGPGSPGMASAAFSLTSIGSRLHCPSYRHRRSGTC